MVLCRLGVLKAFPVCSVSFLLIFLCVCMCICVCVSVCGVHVCKCVHVCKHHVCAHMCLDTHTHTYAHAGPGLMLSHPWSFFDLVHWGAGSQSSLELTERTGLTISLLWGYPVSAVVREISSPRSWYLCGFWGSKLQTLWGTCLASRPDHQFSFWGFFFFPHWDTVHGKSRYTYFYFNQQGHSGALW